jgi:riboflavin transporter FmnP
MLVVFVAASLTALTAPATADPTRRVGSALIVGGAAIGVSMVIDRRWSGVVVGAVSIVFGLLLRDDPNRFVGPVVKSIAAIAAVVGLMIGFWLRRRGVNWFVAAATAALVAATGWLFVRYETELLPLGLRLFGLAAAAVGRGGCGARRA